MVNEVKLLDVVKVPWPTDEDPDRRLPHYGVVLNIVNDIAQPEPAVTVVYGTSKQVSISGYLTHEAVLYLPETLKMAGLRVPTRLDCRRIRVFRLSEVLKVTGSIAEDFHAQRALRSALLEVGFLTKR
ncbi:MAG: hypothetical protein QJR02_11510 [Sinobacteraceae bacterium]|nr:hypothetical protein [Nevskiaceae bacterium]